MNAVAWTLRVTSVDGRTARVATRRHQFSVSRPLSFDVEHEGITALEYALGAVGAEIVTGLRELARRRRLDIEDLEAVVSAELKNPLVYLEVVGEKGDPTIARMHIKVYVTSTESEAVVQTLFRETLERLPLARTFRELIDFQVVLTP
jgi:hypothetical protein